MCFQLFLLIGIVLAIPNARPDDDSDDEEGGLKRVVLQEGFVRMCHENADCPKKEYCCFVYPPDRAEIFQNWNYCVAGNARDACCSGNPAHRKNSFCTDVWGNCGAQRSCGVKPIGLQYDADMREEDKDPKYLNGKKSRKGSKLRPVKNTVIEGVPKEWISKLQS